MRSPVTLRTGERARTKPGNRLAGIVLNAITMEWFRVSRLAAAIAASD